MKACIYVKGKAAGAHEAKLRSLCRDRGWTVQGVYVDQPERLRKTGSKSARITLLDDLIHCKHGFGVVCVERLAHLGVASDDLLWALDEILKRRIAVVAVADGIDTTADNGSAIRLIRALAAI